MTGVSRGVNSATRTGARACIEEHSVNYNTGKKSGHWKLDAHFSCHAYWQFGTHDSRTMQIEANGGDKSLIFV